MLDNLGTKQKVLFFAVFGFTGLAVVGAFKGIKALKDLGAFDLNLSESDIANLSLWQ